jgi:hypothetical protein
MALLTCPECGVRFEYTHKGKNLWNEKLPDEFSQVCVDFREKMKSGVTGPESLECKFRNQAMVEFRRKLGR